MNTALSNARIFDDEYWDNQPVASLVKEEVVSEEDFSDEQEQEEKPDFNDVFANETINIKTEYADVKVKEENDPLSTVVASTSTVQNWKSAKRTIFTRTRNTPYESPQKVEPSTADCRQIKKPACSINPSAAKRKKEVETDPEILMRRQKQIDFGKNTLGYDNYLKTISREQRTRDDPSTPDKYIKYSRRGWDGLIRQWRIKLHKFDP